MRYARTFDIPEDGASMIIDSLPSNTQDRLLFLEAEDHLLIGPKSVAEIVDCYGYFLWMYNMSQEELVHNGGNIGLDFDKNEVKERLEAVTKILAKGAMKIPNQ